MEALGVPAPLWDIRGWCNPTKRWENNNSTQAQRKPATVLRHGTNTEQET